MTKLIAKSDDIAFWQIGNDVYRAPVDSSLDTLGQPASKRWECSRDMWDQFREIFSWATDV